METILERETTWIDDKEEKLEAAICDLFKYHEEAAEGIEKMWDERRSHYNGSDLARREYMIFIADCLSNVVQILNVYQFGG